MQLTSFGSFCGGNLRIAREFRALTQSELAKRVFASSALISLLEAGKKKQPQRDLVQALGTILGFEPGFFHRHLQSVFGEEECNFRHRQTTPERTKAQVRAHATLMSLVISMLRSRQLIPPINVPRLKASTVEEVEVAADRCREYWKLRQDAPIPQIRKVLEDAGVIVVNHLVKSKEVDTFSRYSSYTALIFPNEEIHTCSCWSFEVAPELGHLGMHRGVRTGNKETEGAANLFASALLMPREAFAREFRDLPFSWGHILELKKRWGATRAAILNRAYNLNLIDAVAYRKALKHVYIMYIKGWIKNEPHDRPVGKSGLFETVLNGLGQKETLTIDLPIGKLCAELFFTPDTFHDVIGITIPSESIDRSSGNQAASAQPAPVHGANQIVAAAAPAPEPASDPVPEPYGLESIAPGVKKLFLLRGADNCDRAKRSGQAECTVGIEIWRPEYIEQSAFKDVERFWVIINRSDDREANKRFLRSIAADDQIRMKSLIATVKNQGDLITLFKWLLQQERAHAFYDSTFQDVFKFESIPLLSHTAKLADLIEPPPVEKALD